MNWPLLGCLIAAPLVAATQNSFQIYLTIFQQRNTNLQLEDDKILELITKLKASEYKLEENQLNVKYYVSGYPYRFTWHLSASKTEEFMEFFTAPLLCTLKSSQAKIEELEELLKKKDEEIAGYKLSGAILVRS